MNYNEPTPLQIEQAENFKRDLRARLDIEVADGYKIVQVPFAITNCGHCKDDLDQLTQMVIVERHAPNEPTTPPQDKLSYCAVVALCPGCVIEGDTAEAALREDVLTRGRRIAGKAT